MRISLGLAGITLISVIGAFYMVGPPVTDVISWSTWQFAMLVSSGSCLVSYAYLRTLIGDSTPGKTIPPHVRATLDSLPQGLVVVNPDRRIILANQAFAKVLSNAVNRIEGQYMDELGWKGDEKLIMPWERSLSDGKSHVQGRLKLEDNKGVEHILRVNTSPLIGGEEIGYGVLVSCDDVTREEVRNAELTGMLRQLRDSRDQIHRQNQELQVLATRDPLTKAYNRRSFFEQLKNLWSAAVRYDHALCCIMLDLDHFKSINDTHGHARGDAVLRDVASVLSRTTRHSDILCRYGGEEFCILVPHIKRENAVGFAENLRKAIENCDMHGLQVTASIGVASIDNSDSPERLIDHADQALYHAKNTGRNRVVCWNDQLTGGERRQLPISISDEAEPSSPIPFQTVSALTSALAYRDPSTAEHSRRVADMCVKVATQLMPLCESYILENAALLHDIGKVGVPDSILLKPGQLSEEEWIVMRNHDRIGQEIIRSTFGCDELADIVRSLHDWHNAWRENDTPIQSLADQSISTKILAIADSYDSMVTDRVYRSGRSQAEAFEELRRCAGKQFDAELVEHFIGVMGSPGVASSDTNVVNKQVAIRLGTQIESLARALDEKDVDALAKLTSELRETTAASHVAEIAKLADELNVLATTDSAWVNCLQVTLELLDICRKTQRMHLDDSVRTLG